MAKAKTRSKVKKKGGSTSPLPEGIQFFVDDAIDWCHGRMWFPRLLLLILFAYLLVLHLQDPICWEIFNGLNLGFHEMGHAIFNPFGEFIGIAGGSFFQCAVPLLSTLMFFRQRDYFGIAICFGWLSTNLFGVATYAEDARARELPLVSPFGGGEEIIHDWNYLLTATHMLAYDIVIGRNLRFLAVLSMLICLIGGGWLIYNMFRNPQKATYEDGAEEGEEDAAVWPTAIGESAPKPKQITSVKDVIALNTQLPTAKLDRADRADEREESERSER